MVFWWRKYDDIIVRGTSELGNNHSVDRELQVHTQTWNRENRENVYERNDGESEYMCQRRRDGRRMQRIRQRNKYLAIGFICCLAVIALAAGYLSDKAKAAQETVNIQSADEQNGSQLTGEPQVTKKGLVDNEFLTLLNPWHMADGETTVNLVELSNGQMVDERCYPDLQDMIDDCRAAGLTPVICSAYRSREKQETLFNNQVNAFIAEGYSEEDARTETAKSIAVPGTSEHQLGLAVDIVDYDYQLLDEGQEDTEVQKWLMENSWKYGFILRYPNEKSEITGIIYEPWHYRYVGKTAAAEIYELGVCLEEYLEE